VANNQNGCLNGPCPQPNWAIYTAHINSLLVRPTHHPATHHRPQTETNERRRPTAAARISSRESVTRGLGLATPPSPGSAAHRRTAAHPTPATSPSDSRRPGLRAATWPASSAACPPPPLARLHPSRWRNGVVSPSSPARSSASPPPRPDMFVPSPIFSFPIAVRWLLLPHSA